MGDGTTGNNHYPDDLVNTPSGRFIVDMSMSGSHACIVLDDGSVACWGNNNKGQLGLGNTTQQNQPVVLTGLDDLWTTSVHEMLVDPANYDFRPKWAHTFTSSMQVHMMRMTATPGPPVYLGPTPHRVPQLQVVCSIMQTTTMQTQSSLTVPVYSLPTLHHPRSTCVSILTLPTAVPTVAAAPTSLTCQASTTEQSPLLVGLACRRTRFHRFTYEQLGASICGWLPAMRSE